MGSSSGLSSVRATRSDSIRKIAPPNAQAGSSRLWFGPVSSRTICGVTRPTKPIDPPMDTHTPISADTHTSSRSFTRRTFTPMKRALSSPTAKAFSSSACSRIAPPKTTNATSSISAFV